MKQSYTVNYIVTVVSCAILCIGAIAPSYFFLSQYIQKKWHSWSCNYPLLQYTPPFFDGIYPDSIQEKISSLLHKDIDKSSWWTFSANDFFSGIQDQIDGIENVYLRIKPSCIVETTIAKTRPLCVINGSTVLGRDGVLISSLSFMEYELQNIPHCFYQGARDKGEHFKVLYDCIQRMPIDLWRYATITYFSDSYIQLSSYYRSLAYTIITNKHVLCDQKKCDMVASIIKYYDSMHTPSSSLKKHSSLQLSCDIRFDHRIIVKLQGDIKKRGVGL